MAAALVDEAQAVFETTRLRDEGSFLHFRFHKLGDYLGDAMRVEVFLFRPECGSTWTRFAESLVFDEGDDLDAHVERATRVAENSLRSFRRDPAAHFAMLAI